MHDLCTYGIWIQGEVDQGDISAVGPLQVTVEQCDAGATLLTVCTDQSGLIGLLRYLHGLGFVLLSVVKVQAGRPK